MGQVVFDQNFLDGIQGARQIIIRFLETKGPFKTLNSSWPQSLSAIYVKSLYMHVIMWMVKSSEATRIPRRTMPKKVSRQTYNGSTWKSLVLPGLICVCIDIFCFVPKSVFKGIFAFSIFFFGRIIYAFSATRTVCHRTHGLCMHAHNPPS